jgi:VWFA-related protein
MAGTGQTASDSIRADNKPPVVMRKFLFLLTILSVLATAFVARSFSQGVTREVRVDEGGKISIINLSGRVEVVAKPDITVATLSASSSGPVSESEIKIDGATVVVESASIPTSRRIDLSLVVPERVGVRIETGEGEVRVSGDLASVEVKTETATIAVDVPTDDLKYDFLWTASRPRFLSDIQLAKVKERSGGRFQLKGKFRSDETGDRDKKGRKQTESSESKGNGDTVTADNTDSEAPGSDSKEDKPDTKERSKHVSLAFTTARGIVLLNVPPNEVTSDLRERPLTNAAKAIIRSGDVVLTDAIRRATPKYFGDYSRTLPPMRREPLLASSSRATDVPGETTKDAIVRVTDMQNRSIADLRADDFTVAESGAVREIVSVRPHSAPVNLVLLLDVSGSVDNYVNFIRKAARAFIETARAEDRISIILFNEDVKVLSGFSTNKAGLSTSLDTFDAGGSTAYYDAIAYTLADTLRPLRGERTAIVVLTDGDDNRSFLPFDSLIGAIEESGALIYPLYVPSALIAASETNDPNRNIDPLRTRYMTLSARAEGEGEKIAKVSGGVYYPITQLSQIQKAYDDIVAQIRTAYVVNFRSGYRADPDNRPSPRLKVRVNKPNVFAQVSSVTSR